MLDKTLTIREYEEKYDVSIQAPIFDTIRGGQDVANLMLKEMTKLPQEEVVVLTLNTKHEVINKTTITKGLLNHSQIHPREIFRTAIRDNAASIIVVHNHPSGSIELSEQDKQVASRIKESGELLDIRMLDFLVVTKSGWSSINL